MSGEQLAALGVVVGIVASLYGLLHMVRQSIRETAQQRQAEIDRRQAEIDRAVKLATDPIREELTRMTEDRNYHRQRADTFEDQLRRPNQ